MDSKIINDNNEPFHNILPLDYHPQSNKIIYKMDDLIFNSKFDSGNLLTAQRIKDFSVNHYINL